MVRKVDRRAELQSALEAIGQLRPMYKPEQAGAALGVSRATIYRMVADGTLKAKETVRGVRIVLPDLLDYLERD